MCNIIVQRAILLKRCVFKFVYNIPAKYEFEFMFNLTVDIINIKYQRELKFVCNIVVKCLLCLCAITLYNMSSN